MLLIKISKNHVRPWRSKSDYNLTSLSSRRQFDYFFSYQNFNFSWRDTIKLRELEASVGNCYCRLADLMRNWAAWTWLWIIHMFYNHKTCSRTSQVKSGTLSLHKSAKNRMVRCGEKSKSGLSRTSRKLNNFLREFKNSLCVFGSSKANRNMQITF